jgi:hypothetical protein
MEHNKNISVKSLFATCFMLAFCSADSLVLKMEAIVSSGTVVAFHWSTRHYIPEHRLFHCKISSKYKYPERTGLIAPYISD